MTGAARTTPRRSIALACLLLVGATGDAHALRCGNELVSPGDSSAEVRRLCGEPVSVDEREEFLTYGLSDPVSGVYVERTRVVRITEWTYNLGPNRLMRRLRFEDGRLLDADTLGYGY